MISTRSVWPVRAALVLPLIALVTLWGCYDDRPTGPVVRSVELAKGGNGGGGSPDVDEADPPSAPQDTTLDVRILGSGFEPGSDADFTLNGTLTGKVNTNSTQFVSESELVANVSIALDADVDLYDVEVRPPRGKKGIGADLFAVTPVDPDFSAVTMSFGDGAAHNIRSDAEIRDDAAYSGPAYLDGRCGVAANIGNLGDARLDPAFDYSRGQHRKECGEERALIFEFDQPGDGGSTKPTRIDPIFMNIDHVETVTGTDVLRQGQFNLCNRMFFNPNDAEFPNNGSDLLLVSFDDGGTPGDSADDSWTVRTQPYPNDKAFCKGDQRLWHMPFELTIRRVP